MNCKDPLHPTNKYLKQWHVHSTINKYVKLFVYIYLQVFTKVKHKTPYQLRGRLKFENICKVDETKGVLLSTVYITIFNIKNKNSKYYITWKLNFELQ